MCVLDILLLPVGLQDVDQANEKQKSLSFTTHSRNTTHSEEEREREHQYTVTEVSHLLFSSQNITYVSSVSIESPHAAPPNIDSIAVE